MYSSWPQRRRAGERESCHSSAGSPPSCRLSWSSIRCVLSKRCVPFEHRSQCYPGVAEPRRLLAYRFLVWISFPCGAQAGLWHGLHAKQLQPQAVYALEDAIEVRLVYDLPDEDRLPLLGLHAHPLEGGGIPLAKLASYHYAVDRPLAHNLSISLQLYPYPHPITP